MMQYTASSQVIRFITYSNELYAGSRDYCAEMALKKGKVDKVTAYTPDDIDRDFYEKYKRTLDLKAGNGLWLWKPYFVYKELEKANDGDIVLYCDAGSYFFKSCKPIIDSMTDDIWVSDIPLIEKQFTKPELFESMGCVGAKYEDTNQIQGNFIAIRKTDRGIRFVKEWLDYCCAGDNLLRETRYFDNPPEYTFIEHRSDQSVLSLLSKKWNITPHLDPSQYGRVPEKYYAQGRIYKDTGKRGEYAPCIILHRCRKPEKRNCFNQWLCTWLPVVIVHNISKPCKKVRKLSK